MTIRRCRFSEGKQATLCHRLWTRGGTRLRTKITLRRCLHARSNCATSMDDSAQHHVYGRKKIRVAAFEQVSTPLRYLQPRSSRLRTGCNMATAQNRAVVFEWTTFRRHCVHTRNNCAAVYGRKCPRLRTEVNSRRRLGASEHSVAVFWMSGNGAVFPGLATLLIAPTVPMPTGETRQQERHPRV